MFPKLLTKDIEDKTVDENFSLIANYFVNEPVANMDLHFLEITAAGAVTNYKFQHGLGFTPKDIIITQNYNNVTFTVNWPQTNSTDLVFTTSGATTIRALVGRYE